MAKVPQNPPHASLKQYPPLIFASPAIIAHSAIVAFGSTTIFCHAEFADFGRVKQSGTRKVRVGRYSARTPNNPR